MRPACCRFYHILALIGRACLISYYDLCLMMFYLRFDIGFQIRVDHLPACRGPCVQPHIFSFVFNSLSFRLGMFDKERKHSFDQAYEQRDNPTEFVSKKHSSTLIALVVLFYFTISLSVVFLNKFILSSAKYEFPYPLFIAWFQLMVALVLLFALSELGKS